jgi:hypothetical protein
LPLWDSQDVALAPFEVEERRFWDTHDSGDYVDWSKAEPGLGILGRTLDLGSIFRASAGVPKDRPRVWSVEFHQRKSCPARHDGNAADFGEAKAVWKRCRESADVPIHLPFE